MRIPPALFRAVLCGATALMMAVSWPLWVSGGLFPRVPFVGGLAALPEVASWVRFGIVLAALMMAGAGVRWRAMLGLALVLLSWMILEDQFRLQPWAYQFLLMGFALAVCPEAQAMGLCRLFLVAMYFHSGLSKLDYTFLHETGEDFLWGAVRLFGREPIRDPVVKRVAILAMPCWEIIVAMGLVLWMRRPAVVGAIVQHLALIAILSPWGLKHSANVLIWNAALIPQVVLLFWPRSAVVVAEADSIRFPRLAGAARWVVIAAAILPFGERWGVWDTWPSFGLYAGENERLSFEILTAQGADWPDPVGRYRYRIWTGPDWTWYPIRLKDWSLEERRVPLYPSSRTLNGVAEALAARYGGPRAVRVVVYGRAGRLTGHRTREEFLGLEAIRRRGDSFWLNAHPAP